MEGQRKLESWVEMNVLCIVDQDHQLPDKSQISRKSQWTLPLKIEKKESEKLKLFRNYSSRLASVLSTQSKQAEPEQQRKRNQAYLEILIPLPTIFESNKIKEEVETMKFQNEYVMLKTLKTLINELNRPVLK